MSKGDSVLVQKIKDKIELLKKLKERNIKKNFDTVYKDGYFSGGIDCLEELLETVLEELNKKDKKTYWEQIMTKEKMTIEEAETIIDDMYQDRFKIIETKTDKGVTIHPNLLDDVEFTNLEFASVRALREIQSLRRKLNNSIPKQYIEEKIQELKRAGKIKNRTFANCGDYIYQDEIDILEELLEGK